MSTLTFLSGLLVLSQVAIQAIAVPAAGNVLGLIQARQTGALPTPPIPSQCQSACTGLANLGTTCASGGLDCLCSDSSGQAFVSCGNCVISLPGVTADMKNSEEQALQGLTQTCQQGGHPFSTPLTLGSGSSTGTGSGSGNGTGSSTTGSSTGVGGGKNSAVIVSFSTLLAAFGIGAGVIAVAI